MNLLARGKYVITDAAAGETGILTDGAAYISGGRIVGSVWCLVVVFGVKP